MIETTTKLDGFKLKNIIKEFFESWKEKINRQGNVHTFSDFSIEQGFQLFYMNMDVIPWEEDIETILNGMANFADRRTVEGLISQMVNWHYGRFVDFEMRTGIISKRNGEDQKLEFLRWSDRDRSFNMSQGRFDCLKWKDIILFKTAYDLGIYQMILWELKPKTIIEIGSGEGGSAIWMADLMKAYNLECKIISIDIVPPKMEYDTVSYIKGDCNEIDAVLDVELLKELPHPWLVIEDAHVNVYEVLSYFDTFLKSGDYLIIEDSIDKKEEISRFTEHHKENYKVDTQYCDFFGHNMTCSIDSILKRI